MFLTHLTCARCGLKHDWAILQNLCRECQSPLLATYNLDEVCRAWRRDSLKTRPDKSLWRYREVLPLPSVIEPTSLGEGGTPLLRLERIGAQLGLENLYVKDESENPTQSFKARGMAVAVSMAKHLGATKLAVPSAGNAGGALAAYAARAGLEAFIFMPRDTPPANIIECRELGAHVDLIDGLITDCAAEIARRKQAEGWFDMSTLKEPYRIEGKKTLGYEIAEQLDWQLPDVILYPTGGGTGLIGMWKAFDEMETLGWIDKKRPRMYSVQSSGCAPIVRAFEQGLDNAPEWESAQTAAWGLRVPRAVGDRLMLRALRQSKGGAIAVPESEIEAAAAELRTREGIDAGPETGAALLALRRLIEKGEISKGETVVLFNTGGNKYHS